MQKDSLLENEQNNEHPAAHTAPMFNDTDSPVDAGKEKAPKKAPAKQQKKSQEDQEKEKLAKENEDLKDQKISEYGQTVLDNGKRDHKIHLLSIIGEIEAHECLPQHNKTTKYEHELTQ